MVLALSLNTIVFLTAAWQFAVAAKAREDALEYCVSSSSHFSATSPFKVYHTLHDSDCKGPAPYLELSQPFGVPHMWS